MIQVDDGLWVGGSTAPKNVGAVKAGAVLNVAQDLIPPILLPVEYAQVGLVDGPGNEVSGYCAAVLCLKSLVDRHDCVVVYDHDGGRAFAVALMYLNLKDGQQRPNPLAWSYWPTWREKLAVVSERTAGVLPAVNMAHIEAFDKVPWGLLEVL